MQRPGIDYEDAFAPLVRYQSFRMFFVVAVHENLDMLQFDIKTAFLYGTLEEEIYIKVPQGLDGIDAESNARRLIKSLYGLNRLLNIGT